MHNDSCGDSQKQWLLYTGLGRASAYGTGGPGFESWGRVIPKTLKMVVMASLLGAQELRDSITTDSSVSV